MLLDQLGAEDTQESGGCLVGDGLGKECLCSHSMGREGDPVAYIGINEGTICDEM